MKINKDKKVKAIEVKKDRRISELLSLMENTGFQGKNSRKNCICFRKND